MRSWRALLSGERPLCRRWLRYRLFCKDLYHRVGYASLCHLLIPLSWLSPAYWGEHLMFLMTFWGRSLPSLFTKGVDIPKSIRYRSCSWGPLLKKEESFGFFVCKREFPPRGFFLAGLITPTAEDMPEPVPPPVKFSTLLTKFSSV